MAEVCPATVFVVHRELEEKLGFNNGMLLMCCDYSANVLKVG